MDQNQQSDKNQQGQGNQEQQDQGTEEQGVYHDIGKGDLKQQEQTEDEGMQLE